MAAGSGQRRTSVQVGAAEHDGLVRAQLDLSQQAGRRLTLAEVIAELLKMWSGQRQTAGR